MTASEMLRGRIKKNLRRDKALLRTTTCYRIYDRDIPEIPLALDVYGDWLHAIWYETKHGRSDAAGLAHAEQLAHTAAETLSINPAQVVHKRRARRLKGQQVGRLDDTGQRLVVEEDGRRYGVNLQDFIDTGLFLDHRPLRSRIADTARDRRVLNLFCYTGSLSVAAAQGGATHVTSVDLSERYLAWAEDNFRLNRLDPAAHRTVATDCRAFLDDDRTAYDLIVLDPPIASTSARARDFDVQADATWFITRCLDRLAPGGVLYFSTPLTTFVLDDRVRARAAVQDLTAATTPKAFRHQPHQCYLIEPGRAT